MGRRTDIKINENNIFLEVEDMTECCFELWEVEGKKNSIVRVKIPIKDWERILKKWDIQVKKPK